MTIWIIEPHDPLIVRDGRPFGPNPGARAQTLKFPYPSTVVGAFRTLAGSNADGLFDPSQISAVKQIGIRGPLLVELGDDNKPTWLVLAPSDALLLRKDETSPVMCHRLRPLDNAGALSDLPVPLRYPVGMIETDPQKPSKNAPRYWYWHAFAEWLVNPPDVKQEVEPYQLGHNGPGQEWRLHVAINADTLTGEEGALFATSGLEFSARSADAQADYPRLTSVKRLALATAVDNPTSLSIKSVTAAWGGERRASHWYQRSESLPPIPDGLADAVAATGYCRLFLLTPACFTAGWLPDWLLQTRDGVTPQVEAAVVGKPQTVSGWDFERGGPKPTRRLVPAGSVYFLRLEGNKAAIKEWVERIWLQNVSDTEEDRLSGFGLTAVGVWDGAAKTLEVSHG